jgi:hypothetical protein
MEKARRGNMAKLGVKHRINIRKRKSAKGWARYEVVCLRVS